MDSKITKERIKHRIESCLKRRFSIKNDEVLKKMSNTAENIVNTLFIDYHIIPKDKSILVHKINESTYKNAYSNKTYDIKDISIILDTAEPMFSGPKCEYSPPYFWICLK